MGDHKENTLNNATFRFTRQTSKGDGIQRALKCQTICDDVSIEPFDEFEVTDYNNVYDYYNIVCINSLNLDISKELFNQKVEQKIQQHNLNQLTAQTEATIDLMISKDGWSTDRALLAVVAAHIPWSKELQLVARLLHRGANVNVKNENLQTPLHFTVNKRHLAVTERLLEYGASATQNDFMGRSPIGEALINLYDELSALLMKSMQKHEVRSIFTRNPSLYPDSPPLHSLHDLIESGSMKKTVLAVLDSLIETNDSSPFDDAILHLAPLEVDCDGLSPKEDGFSACELSCLQLIARTGDQDLICHPSVRFLLEKKWKCFARNTYIMNGVIYTMVLIALTAVVILAVETKDPADYKDPIDMVRAGLEILIVIAVITTFVQEVVELKRFKCHYFHDPYNYIDLGSAVLLSAVIPLRFLRSQSQWGVFSVAYILSVLRMLKYAAIFRRFRTYIRIMFTLMTQEFGEFIVMFSLVALAFAGSFALALRHNEMLDRDDNSDAQTSNFWSILLTALRVVIEDASVIKYYDNEGPMYGWLATLIFVVYLFVVLVMFLNVLIAQLTDIYDSIRRGAQTEAELNRAWIIARVELNTLFSVLHKDVPCRIKHYADKQHVPLNHLQFTNTQLGVSCRHNDKYLENIRGQLEDMDIRSRSLVEQVRNQELKLNSILTQLKNIDSKLPSV